MSCALGHHGWMPEGVTLPVQCWLRADCPIGVVGIEWELHAFRLRVRMQVGVGRRRSTKHVCRHLWISLTNGKRQVGSSCCRGDRGLLSPTTKTVKHRKACCTNASRSPDVEWPTGWGDNPP